MKLINKYKFISILLLSLVFTSCEKLLEENNVNAKYTDATIYGNPILAEGVLLRAYTLLPDDYVFNDSYATDDAVTNVLTSNMINMATGGYTSRYYPLSVYSDSYRAFLQINTFLANMEKPVWAYKDPGSAVRDSLFRIKLKGEAYGLRAFWGARLLQYHGGMGSDDVLRGYPIVTTPIENVEDGKLQRNTYAECVKQIFDDCDSAIAKLPLIWTNTGLTTDQQAVYGANYMNRISGIVAMAIKSRVALLAASPAFASGSGVTMQQAAQIAANLMTAHIGITGLNANDVEFYKNGQVTTANYNTNREALWFTSIVSTSSSREANQFPPLYYGAAQLNPSQNFADAFPNSDGTPYVDGSKPANPYAARDPRMAKYLLYNGVTFKSAAFNTTSGDNAIGAKTTSTRTGYYMRKFLDETVVLTPGAIAGKPHSNVRFRYTEILLNFAEAANDAVGPDVAINGFTARAVINALRTRAGIVSTAYVGGLNQAGLAELIKNERRIELCFEGFRFWDLCRWNNLGKLNETVKGIDPVTLQAFNVENRMYEPYMIYPPIPYSETLIYNIVQNKGW
jgi:hypothetical protein